MNSLAQENARILVVDDDKRNLRIMTTLLDDSKYEIVTVSSGEDALEKLKTYTPELILLDIMMPGINGYETCKQIRKQTKFQYTRIILVSGKGSYIRESICRGN